MENKDLKLQNNNINHKNKNIFISNKELINFGCKNCIWKIHNQCPHGLSGNDFKQEGYCQEFVDFLLSFAVEGDSITAVWEKFHLYLARLQSLEDYKLLKELEKEIVILEAGDDPEITPEQKSKKLFLLNTKKNSAKLWWSQLNEQALKSMRYVVDRERKTEDTKMQRLSIQQLNKLIQISAKKVIEHDKS